MLPFIKFSLGRDSLWHAILHGSSVTEHERERVRREIRTRFTPLLDMGLQTRKCLEWEYTLYKLCKLLEKGKF
jgi:hypothetical protein